MKFKNLKTEVPQNGQWCVIKEKDVSLKRTLIFNQPQVYYDDEGGFKNHPRVISWAAIPEHVKAKPSAWKSEYRGDNLPQSSCSCLVCTETSSVVKYAYFHDGNFLGHNNVIAYIEI